jgi:phosphoglycolate phosphatase
VKLQALVFDLDGTLVDSRQDLATAVNRTRAGLGLPPLPVATVVTMVGEGARTLVRRALGEPPPAATGPGDAGLAAGLDLSASIAGQALSTDAFEAAVAAFLAHYREVCLEATHPYPGLAEALSRLAASRPLAVLTNKPEEISRRILEGLGLAPFFVALVGGDSFPTRKPDPQGLLHLAKLLERRPSQVLLIGDSPIDEQTARAAGARFALAEWGFAGVEERAQIRPDLSLPSPSDLLSLVSGGGGARGRPGGIPAGKL